MATLRNLVLAAYRSGASTRREIVAVTHLDPDIVDLIVDLMVHSGELNRYVLQKDCEFGGCRGCPLSGGCVPRKIFSQEPIGLGIPVTRT